MARSVADQDVLDQFLGAQVRPNEFASRTTGQLLVIQLAKKVGDVLAACPHQFHHFPGGAIMKAGGVGGVVLIQHGVGDRGPGCRGAGGGGPDLLPDRC